LSVPNLTHGDAQDLMAAFKQGWERRSPDTILELLSAEIDYRPDPFAEPLIGLNAVRSFWNDLVAAQEHVEFDAERTWVSGTTVLTSWHAAYTLIATAERVRVRAFMTLELNEDLKVARVRQWSIERAVGSDRTLKGGNGDGR
jgi:hypothetical protein